jgi:hypothetical protein
MATLRDEQAAHTLMIERLAIEATAYWNTVDPREPAASELWKAVPISAEHADCMRVIVTDGRGTSFSISTGYPYRQITCHPVLPLMPSLSGHGGFASLSELLPYAYRDASGTPETEASVAIARAGTDPTAVARDFWRRSVTPYPKMLPVITQTIADRQAGYDAQRAVARGLVERHSGFQIGNIHGDSIPIFTSGPNSDLPGLSVQFGGRIITDRTFTMSERVVDALIGAVMMDKAPKA